MLLSDVFSDGFCLGKEKISGKEVVLKASHGKKRKKERDEELGSIIASWN